VVSLRGTVPDQARLDIALKAAAAVKGVQQVIDLLRIASELLKRTTSPPRPATAARSIGRRSGTSRVQATGSSSSTWCQ
jgi:hypothetical protein